MSHTQKAMQLPKEPLSWTQSEFELWLDRLNAQSSEVCRTCHTWNACSTCSRARNMNHRAQEQLVQLRNQSRLSGRFELMRYLERRFSIEGCLDKIFFCGTEYALQMPVTYESVEACGNEQLKGCVEILSTICDQNSSPLETRQAWKKRFANWMISLTPISKEDGIQIAFGLRLTCQEAAGFLLRTSDDGFYYWSPEDLPFLFGLCAGLQYADASEIRAWYQRKCKSKAYQAGNTEELITAYIKQEEVVTARQRYQAWFSAEKDIVNSLSQHSGETGLTQRIASGFPLLAEAIQRPLAEIVRQDQRNLFQIWLLSMRDQFGGYDRSAHGIYKGLVLLCSSVINGIIHHEPLPNLTASIRALSENPCPEMDSAAVEKTAEQVSQAMYAFEARPLFRRMQALLNGQGHVRKADILILLFYTYIYRYEAAPGQNLLEEASRRIGDYCDSAQLLLSAAALPEFYPHELEFSIVSALLNQKGGKEDLANMVKDSGLGERFKVYNKEDGIR